MQISADIKMTKKAKILNVLMVGRINLISKSSITGFFKEEIGNILVINQSKSCLGQKLGWEEKIYSLINNYDAD